MTTNRKSQQTETPSAPGGRQRFESIVVALDGSAEAEAALPYVESIAQAFGSRLTLVCALVPVDETPQGAVAVIEGDTEPGLFDSMYQTEDQVDREDTSYLETVKQRLSALGLDVECREPQMRPAEAIVEVARQTHAGLIAMATQAHGGFRRKLLGSITDEVVHTASCPLLLVGPDTAGDHADGGR